MQILFWIFVVLLVGIAFPTIGRAISMAEADKNREMEQRKLNTIIQEKQRELTTISEEEQELIRKILENHQWQTMISGPYKGKGRHSQEKASALAMQYAKAFAISNGYDEKIITKLYYLYNSTYGEACDKKVTYEYHHEPAKRDVLTERITPARDWKTVDKKFYSIKFFILEY